MVGMLMKGVVLTLLCAGAEPDELLGAADTYAEAGQAKKALALTQKLLSGGKLTPPQKARALTISGTARAQTGDGEGALKDLQAAVELTPEDDKPYLLLGMTLDGLERFQEARAAYARGLEKAPRSARLKRELGATELLLGDAHAAVEHLSGALKVMNDDPELMRDYGEALMLAGRAQDAVLVLQDARQVDGQDAHIAATLGDALTAAGQHRAALGAYQDAVDLDPKHGPAWFHMGLVKARGGDLPGAVAAYRQALKVDASNLKAKVALGAALARMTGQQAAAVDLLRQVVAKDPSYADAHAQLALALEAQGDLAGAEASWVQALQRRERDPRFLEELARVQEKRGRGAEAAATRKLIKGRKGERNGEGAK